MTAPAKCATCDRTRALCKACDCPIACDHDDGDRLDLCWVLFNGECRNVKVDWHKRCQRAESERDAALKQAADLLHHANAADRRGEKMRVRIKEFNRSQRSVHLLIESGARLHAHLKQLAAQYEIVKSERDAAVESSAHWHRLLHASMKRAWALEEALRSLTGGRALADQQFYKCTGSAPHREAGTAMAPYTVCGGCIGDLVRAALSPPPAQGKTEEPNNGR